MAMAFGGALGGGRREGEGEGGRERGRRGRLRLPSSSRSSSSPRRRPPVPPPQCSALQRASSLPAVPAARRSAATTTTSTATAGRSTAATAAAATRRRKSSATASGLRSSMFSFTDVEPMRLRRRRLLALMEEDEAAAAAAAPRQRGWWVSKEDEDAVKLKVAMPGLGKEHVKVWADQDGLVIEGEAGKDAEYDDDDEAPAKYSHRVELPADEFKMDQIKAEMKYGLLKVTVPKIKLEERKDVFRVKVE